VNQIAFHNYPRATVAVISVSPYLILVNRVCGGRDVINNVLENPSIARLIIEEDEIVTLTCAITASQNPPKTSIRIAMLALQCKPTLFLAAKPVMSAPETLADFAHLAMHFE